MEFFDPTGHPIQRGVEEGVGIACQEALGQITGWARRNQWKAPLANCRSTAGQTSSVGTTAREQ
jgi:hypothetical protein